MNREPEIREMLRTGLNDGVSIVGHTAAWIEATERLLESLSDR